VTTVRNLSKLLVNRSFSLRKVYLCCRTSAENSDLLCFRVDRIESRAAGEVRRSMNRRFSFLISFALTIERVSAD
jgi:hypothetical protein